MASRIPFLTSLLLLAALGATIVVGQSTTDPGATSPAPAGGDGMAGADPGVIYHANGDPLRARESDYDTRTEAGRKEIEWVEDRAEVEIMIALRDTLVEDIIVDVVNETAVLVLSYSVKLTTELSEHLIGTIQLFTGFDPAGIRIVTAPFE